MICFPDLNHLWRSLTEGLVPRAICRAPAAARGLPDGRIRLRPSIAIPDEVQRALRQVGAVLDPTEEPFPEEVCCWHQLLPLQRERGLPELAPETAVLFELADPARWTELAAELRRLGRVAAAFHWNEDDNSSPVLLRAAGVPWYSLLGSIGSPLPWRCYLEQAPRVWVELGHRQPLAAEIQPPPGQALLIRAPREWTFLPGLTFREELTELPLGATDAAVGDTPSPPGSSRRLGRDHPLRSPPVLPMRLRLTPNPKTDDAELWVLHDQARVHLEALVHGADDDLLSRLQCAIAEKEGRTVAVVWAPASRRTPPVVVLPGSGYRAYLKLPNLFLPCGARLQPPLRRDAVRELLADDPEEIVWLLPLAGGAFRRESVPLDAFRPLREAVDYLVEHPARALTAWNAAAPFAFESFSVAPEGAAVVQRLRPMAAPPAPKPGLFDRLRSWWNGPPPRPEPPEPVPAPPPPAEPEPPPVPRRDRITEAVQVFLQAPAARPKVERKPGQGSALRPKLHPLEARFLSLAGPPDAPERRALWPQLAAIYAQSKNYTDAAVCWMNALWDEPRPTALAWWGWFRAEARAADWDDETDLQRVLSARSPEAADVRAVAAFCAWSAWGETAPASPTVAAAAMQRCRGEVPPDQFREFLEAHEHLLPVRAVWLAWAGLSHRAGGDALGLARARDRLLERLYHRGLNPDRDLPGFLRFGGRGVPGGFPSVSDWLLQQRADIGRWIELMHAGRPSDPILVTKTYWGKTPPYRPLPYGPAGEAMLTKAYVDLILAWGLARLGAPGGVGRLVDQAREVLELHDPVHTFLFKAFAFRVEEALNGGAATGPLPGALLAESKHLGPHEQRYQADLLRRQSSILEPSERLDPYHGQVQRHYYGELGRQLAALAEVRDRQELAEQLHALLREADHPDAAPTALPRVLTAALELAPRVGEAFAAELLARVGPVLDGLSDIHEQAALLERAMFVAAHFDQGRHVEALAVRFEQMLDVRRGPGAAAAFESLAAQSFRGLRKLGRRDVLERLLNEMAHCLRLGQGRKMHRSSFGPDSVPVLRTLLHVAAGWYCTGAIDQAGAVLDQVRDLLYEGSLEPKDQLVLARAYAAAVGHAPLGTALHRFAEMFKSLERIHDVFSTPASFSLAQLDLIETVVIAVAGDDFALGTTVRRWLDEDEYLVRRRIHQDLRALL